MEKYKVEITGYGQYNGPKKIDVFLEVDRNEVGNYQGNKRYEYISKAISFYHPEYSFDPKNVSVRVTEIKAEKKNIESNVIPAVVGGFVLGKLSNSKPQQKAKRTRNTTKNIQNNEIIDSFSANLFHLNRLEFPDEVKGITSSLDEIYFGIKSYKWENDNSSDNSSVIRDNNNALNFCLSNYRKGFKKLKKSTSDLEIIKEYKNNLKKIIFKKYRDLYGSWAFLIIVLSICLLGLWLLE